MTTRTNGWDISIYPFEWWPWPNGSNGADW